MGKGKRERQEGAKFTEPVNWEVLVNSLRMEEKGGGEGGGHPLHVFPVGCFV